MGFGAAGLWNVGVAAGLAAVYLPTLAGAGLLTAFPLLVDGLLLLGAADRLRRLRAHADGRAAASCRTSACWFFGVALLAAMGAFALGRRLPLLNLDETANALVNAFVARAIGTYWVLGVALGALFYVVPRATGNPLASAAWPTWRWLLWAGFAGLSALGALVDPSVPYVDHLPRQRRDHAAGRARLPGGGRRWRSPSRAAGRMLLSTGTVAFAGMAMAFLLGDLAAGGDRRAAQRPGPGGAAPSGRGASGSSPAGRRDVRPVRRWPITRRRACCAATGAAASLTDVAAVGDLRGRRAGRAGAHGRRHRARVAADAGRGRGRDQRDAGLVLAGRRGGPGARGAGRRWPRS